MKCVAMFLPQFHNCPLNSEWWGEGFTEWDNVRKASPLFEGHCQPRVPLDGYFDLLTDGELVKQSDLARSYGVDSFSFYHYWSKGKMPLRKPLDLVLANPALDVPFCITWGNHSWTRSWKNRSGALDVLMEQEYEIDRDEREHHFKYLCEAMSDPRYTLVNGRPLFQIYKPESLPRCDRWISDLRQYAMQKFNFDPWISGIVNVSPITNFEKIFDSLTTFQPTLALYGNSSILDTEVSFNKKSIGHFIRSPKNPFKKLMYRVQDILPNKYRVRNYDEVVERLILQFQKSEKNCPIPIFPMAFTGFDNTPRYRDRALIINHTTPAKFEWKIKALANTLREKSGGDSVLFINAWNEWGEGMYLQPDTVDQYAYLEALENGLRGE